MAPPNAHKAAHQYKSTGHYSAVAYSDPHQRVLMLFDGLLDRLARARGAIDREAVAEKGVYLSKAIGIVDGLRGCLDFEKGGQIAQNLKALYDYAEIKLFESNMDNNIGKIDEVAVIINNIREGWVGINRNFADQKAVAGEQVTVNALG